MDSPVKPGNDGKMVFWTSYETIKVEFSVV